jgi:hypothetical protein
MPDIDLLPDDLKKLVDRQAEFVEYRTFNSDVERLIRKLRLTEQPIQAAPADSTVAKKALVYIHIMTPETRQEAKQVKAELERQGFVVMRILLHSEQTAPIENVIYWNNSPIDENEAAAIGRVLESMKIVSKAKIIDRSSNLNVPLSRHYEVWLPAKPHRRASRARGGHVSTRTASRPRRRKAQTAGKPAHETEHGHSD